MIELSRQTHRCGQVVRTNQDCIKARNAQDSIEVLHRAHVLDHRNEQWRLRLLAVRFKMLAEKIRARKTNSSAAGWRPAAGIPAIRELVGTRHHRDDNSTRS